MALKCLKKAKSLNPQDADVFKAIVDFYNLLETTTDIVAEVKNVIEANNLLEGSSSSDYIKSWTMKATTVHQLWMSWYVLDNNGMKDQSLKFLEKINASTPGMSHEVYKVILIFRC